MKKRVKKRWVMVTVIVLLLAYCHRASLNPWTPDCNTTPDAAECKKHFSAPGFEL